MRESPPLALIACNDDSMSRALESVFQQRGYVGAHTRSGAQAIELARLSNHDVIVLDDSLEDLNPLAACRALRDDPLFDHTVPIVITSPVPFDPRARMAAPAARARAAPRSSARSWRPRSRAGWRWGRRGRVRAASRMIHDTATGQPSVSYLSCSTSISSLATPCAVASSPISAALNASKPGSTISAMPPAMSV